MRDACEQYEARLSLVQVPKSNSVLLAGMHGSILPVAVAHGEGRAEFADGAAPQGLFEGRLVPLQFVDNRDQPTEVYPANPNGSPLGVAGLCTTDGRVTALMPRPERVYRTVQNSWRPKEWREDGGWMRLFRNARVFGTEGGRRKKLRDPCKAASIALQYHQLGLRAGRADDKTRKMAGRRVAVRGTAPACAAEENKPFDAAAAFGARESVSDLSFSPDGLSVAYIAPAKGQGSALFTLSLAKGAKPRPALLANGTPERLEQCEWVANDRLICVIYGVIKGPRMELLPISRLVGVNADGSNLKMLGTESNNYTRDIQLGGGEVLDLLPDENGSVLMIRNYMADDHTGSRLGSSNEGLAVDRIDTRSVAVKPLELPRDTAVEYLSDGRGTVRIMGLEFKQAEYQNRGIINYFFRPPGSRDWQKLGDYNYTDQSGFHPVAVDHDLNVVMATKRKTAGWRFIPSPWMRRCANS